MSTGIGAGIEELEQKLKAERLIAERFPDAYLGTQYGFSAWKANSAGPHCTDVEVVPTGPGPAGRGSFQVMAYLTIEGMRVYANEECYGLFWLTSIREKHPEAYQLLVKVAVQG